MNTPFPIPDRLLVAIGGNATHPGDALGTAGEQLVLAQRTATALLPLLQLNNRLVITHGNGPVVGKILLRQALSRDRVPPMPMDVCVAHSQGGIAYMLMQSFENALRKSGNSRHVVCLLCQVEVDPDDPAFANPTKPVGFFYDEAEARAIEASLGWPMREDSGRGWRYVVPSPVPRHVADISLVETIIESGAVAISGGGGGIPVIRAADGTRRGVEAVIDKDLTSALMARVLGLDVFLMLTAVEGVYLDYGTERQRLLGTVDAQTLAAHAERGAFAKGSMGPKVDAAIQFVLAGGQRAIIAHLDDAIGALLGQCGTQIVKKPRNEEISTGAR